MALMSFGAGILFHYLLQKPKPIEVIETNITNTPKPHNEQIVELNDSARKRYQELMAEYVNYISNEDNKYLSFKEFMSIRKDELVQNNKYTEKDRNIDNEIKQWLSSYTNSKGDLGNVETSRYSINGSVISPFKNKNDCYILIGVYTMPLNGYSPSIPTNSLSPQAPIANTFLNDCRGGNFSIDFVLSNFEGKETEPVYIAAYAFDEESNLYMFPVAFGMDKNISGIPASLLAKRKHNSLVRIPLKQIDGAALENINVNIKSQNGLWVSPYGIDAIARVAADTNLYRTIISGSDDIARLRKLPFGSNIYIQIFDPNKETRISMVVPSSSQATYIELPREIFRTRTKSANPILVLIPPNNIEQGELIISSIKSIKNKASFSFNNYDLRPLIVEDLDPSDSIIELKQNNESLGIIGVKLRKNEITVLNPIPKSIDKISGKIRFIKASDKQSIYCTDCSVDIKYTDKSVKTGWSGNFNIMQTSIIDDQIELSIEANGQRFLVPLIIHSNIKKLNLDLKLPDQKLLALWDRTEPTLPINGRIYGNYEYHQSYKAFIKGLDNKIALEALYFDEATGTPSRTRYSSSFSRFLFTDVPSGSYVLYLTTVTGIIHTRLINVETGTTTIIY